MIRGEFRRGRRYPPAAMPELTATPANLCQESRRHDRFDYLEL